MFGEFLVKTILLNQKRMVQIKLLWCEVQKSPYKFHIFTSPNKEKWELSDKEPSLETQLIWKTEIHTQGSQPVEVILDIQVKHTKMLSKRFAS